ncbi:MAG: amidohydrolase family protein, partial [Acidobacteria bacterium]|nr:amidohydrolase family protein [Acidobacteriota bacterium]
MKKRNELPALFVVWAFLAAALAQQSGEMVLYNAKIVAVDDHGFSSRLGTIAQAMLVRDGKVVRLGGSDEIRAMAGPGAKVIDLKGRTVLPGFILTHEHPWDWNPVEPVVVKKVLTDDVVVTRFLEGSPEENLKAFPGVLAEAVSKAKPGQWIYIVFTYGRQYQYSPGGNGGYGRAGLDPKAFNILDGQHITKAQLDAAAPNNPVVLRDVFISMQLNQKAVDESRKVFSEPDLNRVKDETGMGAGFRWMFQDVLMKDYYPQLVELMRLGMEWWAGYGMTTFSSNAYGPSNIKVLSDLDRRGQMPMREMWTWNWRTQYFYGDSYFLNTMANLTDYGSDYFWFGGGRIIEGGSCTTAEPRTASALAKIPELQVERRRMTCAYGPDSIYAKLLYDYIKAGNRYVNHHTVGDRDIDNIMAIILKASKDAGMTDEEIRAKRHAFDHTVMFPRPDQIETYKRMGIHAIGNAFEI